MANAARQYDVRQTSGPQRRERQSHLYELPLVRPRRSSQQQIHNRTRVNLRPSEAVSIFTVGGLLVAAVMFVWIVVGYSKLNTVYAQTVTARSELRALEQEGKSLSAQYEEIFDKAALEEAIENSGSELSEIKSNQKVYVDLSEPDNAVVYQPQNEGLLARIQQMISGPAA